MTITRTSWHYRLWRRGHRDLDLEPTNLCAYFWFIVGQIVFYVFYIPLLVITPILLLIVIFRDLWLLLWIPVIIASAVPPTQIRSSLDLVRSYMSAKKARICPLLRIEP